MTYAELVQQINDICSKFEETNETRYAPSGNCTVCGAQLYDIGNGFRQTACRCGAPVVKVIQPRKPIDVEEKLSFLYQEMVSLADHNRASNDPGRSLDCLVAAASVLNSIRSLRGQ
jgi:hypothetical protein